MAFRFILQQNNYQIITKRSLAPLGMTVRVVCLIMKSISLKSMSAAPTLLSL